MSNDSAGFLTQVLERVIRSCGDEDEQLIAEARKQFDQLRGPVFEDEELWETRTRAFLEWFVIEHDDSAGSAVCRALATESDERAKRALLAWHRSYRCLAEIAELADGNVLLIDLIGTTHLPVTERRGLPGVSPGDIAECRVVAFEGDVHFGGWFLWHPEGTRGPLLEHIESLTAAGRSREEILDFAASLRVRALRYSHVPPSRVYAQAPALSAATAAQPAP